MNQIGKLHVYNALTGISPDNLISQPLGIGS